MLIPLFFAQTSTETGGIQLVDWITRVGITGVLAYIWWLERKERLASQDRERESHARESSMLERMIPVLTEATAALERVQESMKQVQENLTDQYPQQRVPQVQSLLDRMDALTEELRSRPPRGG